VSAFDALPPLGRAVRTIVVVPARDEAERIESALRAIVAQRTRSGAPLAAAEYETLVFANNCRDATARVARAFAAREASGHAIRVVQAALPSDAHVGTARRTVMDAAAERFFRAGRPRGAIVSTDADTVVAHDWIDSMRAELDAGADAVMGRVTLSRVDRASLPPDAARLYLWDMAYRRARAHVEAALDPVAWDPLPRHAMSYAASLTVRADAYRRAGGLPPLPRGEDAALHAALERVDARVRHSLRVRVTTSPRVVGRVAGGFANFMRQLQDAAGPGRWLVEHPEETLRRIRAGAALRRYHGEGGAAGASYRAALELFGLDFAAFSALYEPSETFGLNLQRIERAAFERGTYAGYGRVPVARALAELRAASAAPSRSAIRTSVASGAG
jgi:hypothetical protein